MNGEIYNLSISSQTPFQYYRIQPPVGPGGDVVCAFGTPIARKYCRLKRRGFTGEPASAEVTNIDGVGRSQAYNNGMGFWSIWWHPETGAYEVHGAIHEKWFNLGYLFFGYPITDEIMTPDGIGRFNHFRAVHEPGKPEKSIYWTPQTGAHAVTGVIRTEWARLGWEKSSLGYPISDEQDRPGGGRIQYFQRGSLYYGHPTTPSTPPPPPPPPPARPRIDVSMGFAAGSLGARNLIITGSGFKGFESIKIYVTLIVNGQVDRVDELEPPAQADVNGYFSYTQAVYCSPLESTTFLARAQGETSGSSNSAGAGC